MVVIELKENVVESYDSWFDITGTNGPTLKETFYDLERI